MVKPQSATFLCNATARPRPQITWWRLFENGSFQLVPVEDTIEITTDTSGEREILSSLTIVMADPADAQPGMYICKATNEPGQDTANAELTVHGKKFANLPVDWPDPAHVSKFNCLTPALSSSQSFLKSSSRMTVSLDMLSM